MLYNEEISEFIKSLFTKKILLSLVEDRLELKLPLRLTHGQIVDEIIRKGKETSFCESVFKTKSFAEALSTYKKEQFLRFFDDEDLRAMAEEFSGGQKKWIYDKTSRATLIESIGRNAVLDQITKYYANLLEADKLPSNSAVQQDGEWVIGPLGILKAREKRKSWKASYRVRFLLRYLDYPFPLLEFKKQAGFSNFEYDKRDPLLREKFVQLIMSNLNDEEIFAVTNSLCDSGRIQINSIEKYWDFFVTPYGIFQEKLSGDANLSEALIALGRLTEEELDLALRNEGFAAGSMELRIRQKCLKEPPDKILLGYLGSGPILINFAEKLGLVNLKHVKEKDTQVLLNSILLKLGFRIPPSLNGIVAYREKLRQCTNELAREDVPEKEKFGIMNEVYAGAEKLLKDLALFYLAILWASRLNKFFWLEEKEKDLKKMIKEEFGLKKPFDVLTFGDLCDLHAKIDELLQKDEKTREAMLSLFKRAYVIPRRHFEILALVRGSRSEVTAIHDRRTKTSIQPAEIVKKLISLAEEWTKESGLQRVYPYLIKINKEIATEYGIRYLVAIDEEGNEWTLKMDTWIRTDTPYFLMSETHWTSVNPIMLEKFW